MVRSRHKTNDGYSEQIIEGTELELKAMDHVKPLYHPDGTFSGRGIRFGVAVSGAGLALYRGIELEKTGENQYKGVTAIWSDGKVERITDRNTGTHKEIRVTGSDSGPGGLDIWDAVELENAPVDLYFYDLQSVETRYHSSGNELAVLDSRGNEICFADSVTGMAYVYDDYGRMIAYTADDQGQKELVRSIQIKRDGTVETLYPDKVTEDDENGLPVYYRSGSVITRRSGGPRIRAQGRMGRRRRRGRSTGSRVFPLGRTYYRRNRCLTARDMSSPVTWESSCGIPGKCRSISFPTNLPERHFPRWTCGRRGKFRGRR